MPNLQSKVLHSHKLYVLQQQQQPPSSSHQQCDVFSARQREMLCFIENNNFYIRFIVSIWYYKRFPTLNVITFPPINTTFSTFAQHLRVVCSAYFVRHLELIVIGVCAQSQPKAHIFILAVLRSWMLFNFREISSNANFMDNFSFFRFFCVHLHLTFFLLLARSTWIYLTGTD